MGLRMQRGKGQVLLNFLPGKTFDFEKIWTIARVDRIRAVPRTDLSTKQILRAVEQQTRAWTAEHRPIFRDLERGGSRFVLVEPLAVESSMFPLVFWCQNPACGVIEEPRTGIPRVATCGRCHTGRLVQLRFVRVHRCGALEPLIPPACERCHSRQRMALDTRGSERTGEFQWVCRSCSTTTTVFAGRCRTCTWPDPKLRNMHVEVHRAGRTFYPHYAVLLNQPGRDLGAFLAMDKWQAVAAATFLKMPEIGTRKLVDFARLAQQEGGGGATMSDEDRARLREQYGDEMAAQFERMQAQLHATRQQSQVAGSPDGLARLIVERSGVPWESWESAGQELFEAVMPLQLGSVTELALSDVGHGDRADESARKLGLSAVTLVSEFPITTATFGYSRVDYQPNACRLNPFPPDPDHGGKFPIYVDVVQADAILLRLNPSSVLKWMTANGCAPDLQRGASAEISAQGYFVKLLDGVLGSQTVDHAPARLAFGLLHTLSHLAIRRAALLCGLESTSISEYVLPRALTSALYCNHRFGARIGALSALFEQSLAEWLSELRAHRTCVYDPVCIGRGGTCHACTHLAETSCRYFNLNLGRSFLFGGPDPTIGTIRMGYLDFCGI